MTWNTMSNPWAIFPTWEKMLLQTPYWVETTQLSSAKLSCLLALLLKYEKFLPRNIKWNIHLKQQDFKMATCNTGEKCRMLHSLKGTYLSTIYFFLQMAYHHFLHSFLANSTFHYTGGMLFLLLFLITALGLEEDIQRACLFLWASSLPSILCSRQAPAKHYTSLPGKNSIKGIQLSTDS